MDNKKVRLKSLNPQITCYMCKGYLIDATTVIECLHTFCKSCLIKHFQEKNNCCPKCESLIHQSHPSHYVSFDRQMQDIVYKLVPGLHKKEMERRLKFCTERGIPLENPLDEENEEKCQGTSVCNDQDADSHRNDDQLSIQLSCEGVAIKKMKRPYLRCSSQATILNIRKYLAKKLFFDIEKFKDVDILCNNELMGKDHSLKFIRLTRWRAKALPMELQYRKHIDL